MKYRVRLQITRSHQPMADQHKLLFKGILLWNSQNRAKKVVSDSPGLVDFTIRLVNSVLNLPNGQVKYFEEFNLQKNCEINEWFSSNVRLSYTHRIMGLPGGKHCKSLQSNVWLGAVSTLKVVSLDRVCRILPWLLWEADVTNVGALNCKFLCDQCYEIYQ